MTIHKQASCHQLEHLEELTKYPQFVNWDYQRRGNKTTKPPINNNKFPINAHDQENWLSYKEAAQTSKKIGFVLTDEDPFIFIDMDHVLKDGKLCDWAKDLIALLPSTYIEVSPGGDGLHIIYKLNSKPVLSSNKYTYDDKSAIEVYWSKRYFTISGNIFNADTITEISTDKLLTELEPFIKEPILINKTSLASINPITNPLTSQHPQKERDLTDVDVLSIAFNARNGTSIKQLYNGNLNGVNHDHSAADLSFINHLAFYTQDKEQLDRLFRHSELMRPKWDEIHSSSRNTYGEMTIQKALDDLKNTYNNIKQPTKPFSDSKHPSNTIDSVIVDMNKAFACITLGNKVKIMHRIKIAANEDSLSFYSQQDFALMNANKPMVASGDKMITRDRYWLRNPDRKQYKGLCFHPKHTKPGYYNLYNGFTAEPVKGNAKFFLDFCKTVICNNNSKHYEYLVAWMAHLIQKPEEKIGVAVIIRGSKGTGKGQFCNHFGSIFGSHFMTISNGSHLVEKFNAHLEKLMLLVVDEAFWTNDKKAEGILKNLVTEPKIVIERKGIDPVSMDSFLRIIMTTNNDYAVPATNDERRWFVLDCADTYKGDYKYFANLQYQMDNGGREALLHYLLNYQIPDTIELRKAPTSTGLSDQKIHSLTPIEQWWMHCLEEGMLYASTNVLSSSGSVIAKTDCFESCRNFLQDQGSNQTITNSVLGRYLNGIISNLITKGSTNRSYHFPALASMRTDFERIIDKYDWN